MLKNKSNFIIIILLILGIIILGYQRHPKEKVKNEIITETIDSTSYFLKKEFEEYGTIFDNGVTNCSCPGSAVVVIKDTSVMFISGFGTKEVRTDNPVDEHTVFRLGSLSKGFASVTAARLVEQGYFSWDDKVKSYYPTFDLKSKGQADRIEIRHILSHTTGLIRHAYTNLIEEGWTIDRIAAILNEVDLTSKEGDSFAYQNATYSLIEKVINKTTGREYSDILKNDIFPQAGMMDASCSYEDIKETTNKTSSHLKVSNNIYKKIRITKKYYNSVSSGGVNASISDMGNWLQVLLGNRPEIISSESLDSIFKPVISTRHERRFYDNWKETSNSWYGMGWRILEYNGKKIVYHGGYVNGYRSEIAIDRENKVAVCALFNAPCDYAKFVVRDFLNFYESKFLQPEEDTLAGNVQE